jgi:hypothetical protein
MKTRFATAIVIAAFLFPQVAVASSPPANDDFAHATAITSLPFNTTVDLTKATVEAGENIDQCYNSTRTVWYSLSATTRQILDVDISGSDPDVGMRIYYDYGTGPVVGNCLSATYPTASIAVGPSLVLYFQVTADTGTTAVLHFGSEPLLSLSSTLDASAAIDRVTGTTAFSGTVTCNKAARADVFVTAYQRQGRGVVVAQGWTEGPVACGPTPEPWTVRANGALVPGSANVYWTASAGTTTGASEYVQDVRGPVTVKITAR